jgi:hypothetical protein
MLLNSRMPVALLAWTEMLETVFRLCAVHRRWWTLHTRQV